MTEKKHTLRTRLVAHFLILCSLFVAYAVTVTYLDVRQKDRIDGVVAGNVESVALLNSLDLQLHKTRRYEKEYFIYVADTGKKAKYIREWSDSMDKVGGMLAELRNDPHALFAAEDRQAFGAWAGAVAFYGDEFNAIVNDFKDLRFVGDRADRAGAVSSAVANRRIADGKNRLREVFSGIQALRDRKQIDLLIARNHLAEESRMIVYLSAAAVVLALLFMLYTYLSTHRSLILHVRDLAHQLERLSDGDTSVDFRETGVHELDALTSPLGRIRIALLRRGAVTEAG